MSFFMRNFWKKRYFLRALRVALIAGTVIVILIHYEMFILREFSLKNIFQIVLIYLILFYVSWHSHLMTARKIDLKIDKKKSKK